MSHPFLLKNLQTSTVVSESGRIAVKRPSEKECDQANDDEQWGLKGARAQFGLAVRSWGYVQLMVGGPGTGSSGVTQVSRVRPLDDPCLTRNQQSQGGIVRSWITSQAPGRQA